MSDSPRRASALHAVVRHAVERCLAWLLADLLPALPADRRTGLERGHSRICAARGDAAEVGRRTDVHRHFGKVREELAGPDANARAAGVRMVRGRSSGAKGAKVLRWADSDAGEEAENLFRQSLDLAARQSALSWELRGAMSLARLWWDRGHCHRAHGLLAPVFARFSEGLETADLKAAKALLDDLS